MSSYVIGFSLKDSMEEHLCKRTSSLGSITPKSSIHMTFTESAKKVTPKVTDTLKETKIIIDVDNQVMDKEPLESLVYKVDKTQKEEDLLNKQPQVLFDSMKNKPRVARKKCKTYKCTVQVRKINFKNKSAKLTKKIQKYYIDKTNASAQIQKDLCSDSISKVVSRYSEVKNVIAKENLLDAINLESVSGDSHHEIQNNSETYTTSTATTNNSILSQKTLIGQETDSGDSSVVSDRSYSITPDNLSTIEIKSETLTPYKSEIINVAVAVTQMNHMQKLAELVNDKLRKAESLTSIEAPIMPVVPLTSQPPSSSSSSLISAQITRQPPAQVFEKKKLVGSDRSENYSNITLTTAEKDYYSVSDVSSDRFVIARTSSDFTRPNVRSQQAFLMPPKTEVVNNLSFNNDVSHFSDKTLTGMGPEITASVSSEQRCGQSVKNVIVTKDKIVNINDVPKGDDPTKDSNVLKKTFDANCESFLQRNITMPNETVLKAMIEDENKINNSEDVKNVVNIPEMWAKLTLVLNSIMQRLEVSLIEKIIKEMNDSRYIKSQKQPVDLHSFGINYTETKNVADKEILVMESRYEEDKAFQCNLVDNSVIDNLMLKLSIDGPKYVLPRKIVVGEKIPSAEINKKFEVLKPPVQKENSVLIEDDISAEETLTSSTLTTGVANQHKHTFGLLKTLVRIPRLFFRENVFIISLVPSFLVFICLVYMAIALFVKIW